MADTTESESLKYVCEQAHNAKSAESYTWTQILEKIVWKYALLLLFFHVALVATLIFYSFGLYSAPVKGLTIAWVIIFSYGSSLGVTAGAHRLWTHRTYKASLHLRIFLILAHSAAGMNPLFYWVRDHRVHHKFTETDADPHNAKRGFFFSHMGWLALKRHPEYMVQARKIDMSDMLADPVVIFQKKYATPLMLIFCFAIPTAIPVIFWKETILHAALTQCIIRYLAGLHSTWSVNSVAHLWGDRRPYNRFINPVENLTVCVLTGGEGSHNYHHTFPWDYKASEFPYLNFNLATLFINGMAKLGWAYDLREPSPEFVEKVTRRIGDKSKVDKAHQHKFPQLLCKALSMEEARVKFIYSIFTCTED